LKIIKELCLRRDRQAFIQAPPEEVTSGIETGLPAGLYCIAKNAGRLGRTTQNEAEPHFRRFLICPQKSDLFALAKKKVDFETIEAHILQCGMSRPRRICRTSS
jgi:hypothetical protein